MRNRDVDVAVGRCGVSFWKDRSTRVIAIGAVVQRPRVFLMCARCARWFGYPAVRVRCGEGDRGKPASVDATKLDPYLQPRSTKLYERVVASYLKNRAS
jgi:hypothetical protein